MTAHLFCPPNIGYRIQDTGDRIQYTGYRIQDTGDRIQDTGYRIQDTGYRIQDTGYKINETGCRIQYTEYRILDTEFRIQDQWWDRMYDKAYIMNNKNKEHVLLSNPEYCIEYCIKAPGCWLAWHGRFTDILNYI